LKNEHLKETCKQLCNILEEKDNCQQRLARLERKQRNHVDVSLEATVKPAAKKRK